MRLRSESMVTLMRLCRVTGFTPTEALCALIAKFIDGKSDAELKTMLNGNYLGWRGLRKNETAEVEYGDDAGLARLRTSVYNYASANRKKFSVRKARPGVAVITRVDSGPDLRPVNTGPLDDVGAMF